MNSVSNKQLCQKGNESLSRSLISEPENTVDKNKIIEQSQTTCLSEKPTDLKNQSDTTLTEDKLLNNNTVADDVDFI